MKKYCNGEITSDNTSYPVPLRSTQIAMQLRMIAETSSDIEKRRDGNAVGAAQCMPANF